MIWDISPVAFTLFWDSSQWPVFWYGLFFASTFVYGIFFFRYLYGQEGREPDDVYDLTIYFIVGTVLGARLGHVLLYDPVYYFSNPLKILALREGGLASHGAAIGVLMSIWLYSRRRPDQSYLWILDRIGMSVAFSAFLIRIGNFFNSEILGTPTDMPWGVIFSRVDMVPRHPVQLYEACCYFAVFIFQFRYYLRFHGSPPPGMLLGRFFLFVFGARFLMEFFKLEQAVFASGWSLTVGQWLSIPAILLGVFLMKRLPKVLPADAKSRE